MSLAEEEACADADALHLYDVGEVADPQAEKPTKEFSNKRPRSPSADRDEKRRRRSRFGAGDLGREVSFNFGQATSTPRSDPPPGAEGDPLESGAAGDQQRHDRGESSDNDQDSGGADHSVDLPFTGDSLPSSSYASPSISGINVLSGHSSESQLSISSSSGSREIDTIFYADTSSPQGGATPLADVIAPEGTADPSTTPLSRSQIPRHAHVVYTRRSSKARRTLHFLPRESEGNREEEGRMVPSVYDVED